MANKKTQNNLRKPIYGLLIVAGLGLLIFFFVVQPLQVHKQKQDFAKAETSLDTLAAKIEQTIGKADETKKVKSCDRPNLKYEQGPLSCSVLISLIYKDKTVDDANNYLNSYSKTIPTTLRSGSSFVTGSSFTKLDNQKLTQVFYQSLPESGDLVCTISYRYPSGIDQDMLTTEDRGFLISGLCSGPARNEFFPLKD